MAAEFAGDRFVLTAEADQDLDAQADYYDANHASEAADRWYDKARATFLFLAKNPGLGAPWPTRRRDLAGVRTWPIDGFDQFIVFYRPVEVGIEVLRVLRGSRDLGRLL